MGSRWHVVLLVSWAALAGSSTSKEARGQILAMPLSAAEGVPTRTDTTIIEPPAVYTSPAATRSLLPPGTVYSAEPDAMLLQQPGLGLFAGGDWTWELLPSGLVYRSYLAGGREPRLAGQFVHVQHEGWFLDATVGDRVGLLRYGSSDPLRPEGLQLDFEGAAFPRLALDDGRQPVAVDYRYGVPLTYREGMLETKLAFYHLSSHLSDGYITAHPGAVGNGYSRDALVGGVALWVWDSLRLYAEAGWAFHTNGPAEPWEFQFGGEFSPRGPTAWGGAPFLAVNGHIRQDVDFAGGLTVQAGWQWRGGNGQLLRTGLDYFNGKSDQMQFLTQREQQIGMGIWYDF
jgi:hypothetical protein